jgi:cytochrome P450
MEEMLVPGADGANRVDLVSMLQKVFIQFAAAFIGLKGVDSAAGRDELQRVFRPLPLAHHVRFMKEGKEEAIKSALGAKAEYEQTFVRPSLDAIRAMLAEAEARDGADAVHHSVLVLVAQLADPAYSNYDFVVADAIGLLIGAIDTSTHTVTNTVDDLLRWFEEHPEDRTRRTDVDFLNSAMEETLRLRTSPPVLGRIAAEDITLSNGKEIAKGQPVAIYHSVANRDRSVFGEDADQFNPRRQPLRNVAKYGATFGGGSHMCIGQRVVVGDGSSTGSHAQVLRALFEAGIRKDPDAPPTRLAGEMIKYLTYPVVFDSWPS